MTGSSEMDTNKQTEESNNIPNNVGKSENSDSIEVIIIYIMICLYLCLNIKLYLKKIDIKKFHLKNKNINLLYFLFRWIIHVQFY